MTSWYSHDRAAPMTFWRSLQAASASKAKQIIRILISMNCSVSLFKFLFQPVLSRSLLTCCSYLSSQGCCSGLQGNVYPAACRRVVRFPTCHECQICMNCSLSLFIFLLQPVLSWSLLLTCCYYSIPAKVAAVPCKAISILPACRGAQSGSPWAQVPWMSVGFLIPFKQKQVGWGTWLAGEQPFFPDAGRTAVACKASNV